MKKIKIIKRFFTGALIFFFIFSPFSFLRIFSLKNFEAEAQGEEIISGYTEWSEDKIIDNSVLIELGATLVIKQGVSVTFDGGGMDIYGTVVASGTMKNPVIFKKSENAGNYSISVKTSGKLIIRNADISGGGYNAYVMRDKSIFNNALAYGYITGAIDVLGGWLYAVGSNFHDNETAIYVSNQNPNRIKVNKNKFFNNNSFDVYYTGLSGNNFDFKYNWWGSPSGPQKICGSPSSCWYGKFEGEVNFSNWLTAENFRDPVIIIPGILGSEKKDGIWQIDPVFHTYDNLYEEFIRNGYIPEKDIFTFPYDWRNSNVENAQLLKNKITEIKNVANWPYVDIVAHSMGGLLTREYIESDYYNKDINQFIMLGTPNKGAPEAYLKWEAGAFLSSFQEIFLKYYFNHEAKENGYADLFHYIQARITSVKELLPVYGYLYDVENENQLRIYPNDYPINVFLENLNSDLKKERLFQVEVDKIIGNIPDSNSTVAGFNVINADMGENWEHGYPHGFEIIIGDRGLVMNHGDRTVPIESARSENIFVDNLIEIDASHRELPTEAQKNIIEILTGTEPVGEVESNLIKDLLFVSVYSPIDIQVEAPDGKKVGKNFLSGEIINEIDGAYYSGAGAENEFLTIPNPIDGEYKILTEGTGEGEYKIEVAKITEDPDTGMASESVAEITGNATPGQGEEKEVKVAGNEVSTGIQDTIAPEISITSPEENKIYLNNQILKISYTVSDNISQNIQTEITLDGNIFTKENIDLSLQNLGEHKFKITATDEAGNKGEKEISFQTETNSKAISDNVNHYAALNLIKNKTDKTVLISRLKLIQGIEELIRTIEDSRFFSSRTKEKLIQALREQINGQLSWLAEYVKQRSKAGAVNGIDPKIGSLLIENLNFLKY